MTVHMENQGRLVERRLPNKEDMIVIDKKLEELKLKFENQKGTKHQKNRFLIWDLLKEYEFEDRRLKYAFDRKVSEFMDEVLYE